MAGPNLRISARHLAVLLCTGLLLSCATVPPSPDSAYWLEVLPPLTGDSLYASGQVASSAGLLEALAEETGNGSADVQRIIGSLDRVHARIRFSGQRLSEQSPELQLIALGNLSPGAVAFKLNLDPAWERVVLEKLPGRSFNSSHWSYRTYWKSGPLEIAAPRRGVLFLSSTGILGEGEPADAKPAGAEALLRRLHAPQGQSLPAQAREAADAADLFLFIPDPVMLASASAAPSAQSPGALLGNLPIRQVWISALEHTSTEGEEGYEMAAVLLLDPVQNPRSLERLLRLMVTLWLRRIQVADPVGKLQRMAVIVDSESARIDSLFLGSAEIASLFASLLARTPGGEPW